MLISRQQNKHKRKKQNKITCGFHKIVPADSFWSHHELHPLCTSAVWVIFLLDLESTFPPLPWTNSGNHDTLVGVHQRFPFLYPLLLVVHLSLSATHISLHILTHQPLLEIMVHLGRVFWALLYLFSISLSRQIWSDFLFLVELH